MFRIIYRLGLALTTGVLLLSPVTGQDWATGRIAAGAFVPTGADGNTADPGFVLQLTADAQIAGRLGAEAEFDWAPLNIDPPPQSGGRRIRATQLVAAAGLRLSSRSVAAASGKPIVYVSGRIGFTRLMVESDTVAVGDGWIGRTVAATQTTPPFTFPSRATAKAFVLSPRAGILLRPTGRALIDLSVTPVFVFDDGEVSTQILATVGFGLTGRLE